MRSLCVMPPRQHSLCSSISSGAVLMSSYNVLSSFWEYIMKGACQNGTMPH